MNDVLRIARLKIALQRAFLGRAILIFTVSNRLREVNSPLTYWKKKALANFKIAFYSQSKSSMVKHYGKVCKDGCFSIN